MTPKEKAIELFDKYYNIDDFGYSKGEDGFLFWGTKVLEKQTKQCALIAVDEIISIKLLWYQKDTKELDYWQEVKKEIQKL